MLFSFFNLSFIFFLQSHSLPLANLPFVTIKINSQVFLLTPFNYSFTLKMSAGSPFVACMKLGKEQRSRFSSRKNSAMLSKLMLKIHKMEAKFKHQQPETTNWRLRTKTLFFLFCKVSRSLEILSTYGIFPRG